MYAFRMATGVGGVPMVLQYVKTEWSSADPAYCESGVNCIQDACDEEFDPRCSHWIRQ